MEKLKNKVISSALGVTGALAGATTLSSCAGAGCAACLGCAGGGAVLVLAALFSKARKAGKGERDAVA